MFAFLILFIHVVILPFKTNARLEAEIVMLRHQLNVQRRARFLETKVGSRPIDFSSSGSIACFRRC